MAHKCSGGLPAYRQASVGPRKYGHALHTHDANGADNLCIGKCLPVGRIRLLSMYLLRSPNASIFLLWALNKLFVWHLRVPGTVLSTRGNAVRNITDNGALTKQIHQGRAIMKPTIYKNTFYNERNTALQEHRAEARTLKSEEVSTPHHFYFFFLKFIPFMYSYSV